MKVFISFATEDESRAESLFEELHGAGADVFKWGNSEAAGEPTWSQLLGWIGESDVFIVLISQHALQSLPVADEIEHAAYSYSNKRRPGKIIPAILERDAVPPVVIERFPRLDCIDFTSGLRRLMSQLGLQRRSRPEREESPMRLIVRHPDRLFSEFTKRHGRDPHEVRAHPALLSSELFTSPKKNPWEEFATPAAPVLTATGGLGINLQWTAPEPGCRYVLQRSRNPTFAEPETVFEGVGTAYADQRSFFEYHYRVRAVSALGGESRWSNIVSSKTV